MIKRFIHKTIYAIYLFLCMGCISEYSPKSLEQEKSILVIEGTISDKEDMLFYLSRTAPIGEVSPYYPEREAEVYILCNDGTQSVKAIELNAGQYHIKAQPLDPHKQYCLSVQTAGETYQSQFTTFIQTPEIDTISWYKENSKAPVDILLSTHDPQKQVSHYMWTFEEDWEIVATYKTTQYAIDAFFFKDYIKDYEEDPNPYYYCWSHSASKKIILEEATRFPENKINKYPIQTFSSSDKRASFLYCITVQQQALDEQGYKYYKNKQKLIEDLGSIFSPMPAELKGNITCISQPSIPVIGFVSATNKVMKRIFINGEDIYTPPTPCTLYTEDDLKEMYKNRPSPLNPSTLLAMGYRYVHNNLMAPLLWTRVECVDCRAYGTKSKPDFWPNDHK